LTKFLNGAKQAGGALLFAIVIPEWYLLLSQMLVAIDFPFSLPIGDLSTKIRGASANKGRNGEAV
jgi:hypothetical protein